MKKEPIYTQLEDNSVILDEEAEVFYTNASIVAIVTAVTMLGSVLYSF